MAVREAEHAGSWYTDNGSHLAQQLDYWLSQVPADLPQPGARVVIAPHAGYAYSGPCAGWAYRCLDLSKAKRIFILHPSHHKHLSTAALPTVEAYQTPLSDEPLPLDHEIIQHLSSLSTTSAEGRPIRFTTMSKDVDEAEHSCEMQLPYIHRLLQKLYPNQATSSYPPLVPIMIGGTSPDTEKALGKILAPYIADESNAFAISSDFCHWGARFSYTYYVPDAPSPALSSLKLPNMPQGGDSETESNLHTSITRGTSLRSSNKVSSPKIFESIAHVDRACMCAIATGSHDQFLAVLQNTGNTICGRHPIGVFMAGLEAVNDAQAESEGVKKDKSFRFVRYERSGDVVSLKDSSVSYVSAFTVL
jgi:MEMO1 family protein